MYAKTHPCCARFLHATSSWLHTLWVTRVVRGTGTLLYLSRARLHAELDHLGTQCLDLPLLPVDLL